MKSKLLVLAIFCLIASAGVVCAADHEPIVDIQDNSNALEPDAGLALENQTADVPMNVTDNQTASVAGNSTGNAMDNTTGNDTASVPSNASDNATHNSANPKHPTPLLSTGNPIIVVITLITALGAYAVLKRKD